MAKPCLMALSVCDEIHRRFTGLLNLTHCKIQRATNSPSRPASVAITASPTSFRLANAAIAFN